MACKCCCDGCHRPMPRAIFEDGQAVNANAIGMSQRFCCECIPLHLCLTVNGESHYVGNKCVVQISDEDPVLYSRSTSINGSPATLRIRLRVDSYDDCFIYVEISEDVSVRDELLIDHYDCGFCKHWTHTFVLDTSAFGDGSTLETTVEIAPVDNIVLNEKLHCATCRCVCRQACVTRVGFSGGGKTVYDGVFDEEAQTVTWGPVTLRGNLPSETVSFTLSSGTEATGTFADTNDLDDSLHVISGSDGVSFYYEIDTQDTVELLKVKWWGYVNGDAGGTVDVQAWHWVNSAWETVGSMPVIDGVTVVGRVFDLGDEYRGGTGSERCRVRFVGSYNLTVATDCIRTVSSNCCKLYISGESETLPPVIVGGDNACPSPEAQWNLSDPDATVIFFECVKCGGCGSVQTSCCAEPVSRILVADVATNCPGSCSSSSFPMVDNTGNGLWIGGGSPCNVDLQLSCSGGTWNLAGSLGACTILTIVSQSIVCEPFLATFEITFSGGLACCGSGMDPTPITATVTISE